MHECRILFLGDIGGRPGRRFVLSQLSSLQKEYRPDFIFANAENATHGFGLNAATAQELHDGGIDGLTLGNHTWDQKEFWNEIDTLPYVCRPANYPKAPGRNFLIFEHQGEKLAVINLLGRTGMRTALDCPFQTAAKLLEALENDDIRNVIVDFHAETTAEKYALGWFLAKKESVCAVLGTHTHVPTADTRLLNDRTAFVSDIGMCGPYNSVIGCEIDPVIERFVDGKPNRLEVAKGTAVLNAIFLRLDLEQHRALSIERIQKIEANGAQSK